LIQLRVKERSDAEILGEGARGAQNMPRGWARSLSSTITGRIAIDAGADCVHLGQGDLGRAPT